MSTFIYKREVPAVSVDINFMVEDALSTSHISTLEFSHPIITPLPSQSQLTHVGFHFSSSLVEEYLKDALRGDLE
jgi:hypothetical protein